MNKKFLVDKGTSRRATLKEKSIVSRLEKHPLIRNTGQSSAEGKYRYNRGNPVPIKKRSK
jgi:hypothetical protein